VIRHLRQIEHRPDHRIIGRDVWHIAPHLRAMDLKLARIAPILLDAVGAISALR